MNKKQNSMNMNENHPNFRSAYGSNRHFEYKKYNQHRAYECIVYESILSTINGEKICSFVSLYILLSHVEMISSVFQCSAV